MATVREGQRSVLLVVDVQVGVMEGAWQAPRGIGNVAQLGSAVPSLPALIGRQIYTQALSFDPAANAFGFAISDAAVMLVGQ